MDKFKAICDKGDRKVESLMVSSTILMERLGSVVLEVDRLERALWPLFGKSFMNEESFPEPDLSKPLMERIERMNNTVGYLLIRLEEIHKMAEIKLLEAQMMLVKALTFELNSK